MIDFDLTEQEIALRKMARDFAEKEIRPIAGKLDRSENLLQDFPWDNEFRPATVCHSERFLKGWTAS